MVVGVLDASLPPEDEQLVAVATAHSASQARGNS
jgi:hypothetical protein